MPRPETTPMMDPHAGGPAGRHRTPLVPSLGVEDHVMSRRRFISLSLAASASLAFSPLLTACAADPAPTDSNGTLARARQQGFIRVGFANEAPYGYVDETGRVTGAAPELARAVMRNLGVREVDGVPTPFGSLISSLNDGRFDIIAAGMFITPDRCDQILFSDPDYCVEQAFLVLKDNPLGILRYEDIANQLTVKLGVLTGAVEASHATEAGVDSGRIQLFDNPPGLLAALREGLIDAAALSTISLANLASQAAFEGVEVTEGFMYRDQPGCGGFGFRRDDALFRDQFNQTLSDLKAQGAVTSHVEPFGFADAAQAADGLTSEELCTH